MATGVVFLQSNIEDDQKQLGNYKPGNTELIRTMLREQQKECQTLHANPLFKEFRSGGQRQKKFGKGYVVNDDVNAPQFDDLVAEGQARMFELIKTTAVKEEKTLFGVWAAFGQPYVCLGEPSEPVCVLPKLNRDELNSRDGFKSQLNMKNGRGKGALTRQQQQSQQQQQQRNPRPEDCQAKGGNGNGGANGQNALAGLAMSAQDAELQVKKAKSVLSFGERDRKEVMFPTAVLRQANSRSLRARIGAGSTFVDPADASAEINSPESAYGQPRCRAKNLGPLPPAALRAAGEGADGEGSSFFLTSIGVNGEDGQDGNRSNGTGSVRPGSHTNPELNSDADGAGASGAGGGSHSGGDSGGRFLPLVHPSEPMPGDEDNPVYSWHNNFLSVRQSGRNNLQSALYQRAEGRARARTDPAAAAGLCVTLLGQLNLREGRMPDYNAGNANAGSPYTRLEAYQAAQEALKRSAKQKAVAALEAPEIRILQRFYDQLCALVEQQRMSDPLCLMVVHKVKCLLEAGTYLHRPMLTAVIDHVAEFTLGAGLVRYNRFLLAILTFIAKCVGLDDTDLEEAVEKANVCKVVYGTPVPPKKLTPEIIAKMEMEAATAAASGIDNIADGPLMVGGGAAAAAGLSARGARGRGRAASPNAAKEKDRKSSLIQSLRERTVATTAAGPPGGGGPASRLANTTRPGSVTAAAAAAATVSEVGDGSSDVPDASSAAATAAPAAEAAGASDAAPEGA